MNKRLAPIFISATLLLAMLAIVTFAAFYVLKSQDALPAVSANWTPQDQLQSDRNLARRQVTLATVPWTTEQSGQSHILIVQAKLPWLAKPLAISTLRDPIPLRLADVPDRFPRHFNLHEPWPMRLQFASVPTLKIRPNPDHPNVTNLKLAEMPWRNSTTEIRPARLTLAQIPAIPVKPNPNHPHPAQLKSATIPWPLTSTSPAVEIRSKP